MNLKRLLESDDVLAVFLEYACEHQPGMTADEFLSSFAAQGTIGAALGQRMGRALGVKNTTTQSFSWSRPSLVTCGAVLCGCLAAGVVVDFVDPVEATEAGQALLITGTVPSSPAHFGGELTVEISEEAGGSKVFMRLVIPGQVFAWGAGKRLFKRIRNRLEDATVRIEHCPSLI